MPALAWGARGPEFKSRRSDQLKLTDRKYLWPSLWPSYKARPTSPISCLPAAAAIHLDVARCPDRGSADVKANHGILGREVAQRFGEKLRVDRSAASMADSERVDVRSRLAIVCQVFIKVAAVVPGLKTRQQCIHGCRDVTDKSQAEPASAAEVAAADINLRDLRIGGLELTIGEVGAEHQQRIAGRHRAIA
jgi:hypothetical protein